MNKSFILSILLILNFNSYVYADNNIAIKNSLNKFGIISNDIQPAPILGMQTVLTDNGVLYITDDGKYIIHGPIYNIENTQLINITNKLLMQNLNKLEKEMIIYKSPKEKYVITVFTDIACSYCRKLHTKIKDYNDLGITVRYLAFPRSGAHSQLKKEMQDIWCAKNRKQSFDNAIHNKHVYIHKNICNIDIINHYYLGIQFNVTGTPAIILNDGTVVPGYQEPKEIKALLDTQLSKKIK